MLDNAYMSEHGAFFHMLKIRESNNIVNRRRVSRIWLLFYSLGPTH